MTPSLGVRVDGSPKLRRRLEAIVASLPESFHTTGGRADVVALDGDGDWTERAEEALRDGVRAIVVADPDARDARELLADAARLGATVALDSPWAHNPATSAAAAELARSRSIVDLLEVESISPTGHPVLVVVPAQLALVRAVLGPVASAKLVAATDRGYTLLGSAESGVRVKLVSVMTDARPAAARLRFIGRESSIELSIPDPSTARPAHLTVTTVHGSTLMPTIFESARRSVWRAVHAAVTADRPLNDLGGFVDDATIARGLADRLAELPQHDLADNRRRQTR